MSILKRYSGSIYKGLNTIFPSIGLHEIGFAKGELLLLLINKINLLLGEKISKP